MAEIPEKISWPLCWTMGCLEESIHLRTTELDNLLFYLPRTLMLANVETEHAVNFIPEVISYLLRSKS